ncbi:MAG: hypothetical protein K2L51_04965, partial [Clostridiales bacterium]|nr:hypothetical protein [Clostridiales bacterium]
HYWELLKVFTQLDEEMRALLASQTETLAKYDKTVEAVFAQEIELSELHYAEGFRFGMLLGMEIK